MAPIVLWTAVLAAFCSLGVSAMPMLTEQPSERLAIPPSVLEWYLQQRDLQQRDRDLQYRDDREGRDADGQPIGQPGQLQPSELHQFKQWLDTQLARLPVAPEAEEPNKALVVPQQPKRGNYMALCHFKICNMGRKRSPRIQPQDLP
ncbi:uncharacterized protein LOC117646501 [Thrips palmi]|uniref:Uncharacterized protein LOC117646501 n=1 Tax=Thrips palmi TaxID=161013 RepID=A0A6P8Z0D0_THRPL|nr:uncharacterized protein LOC117646501 [Thrips palmi]